MKPTHFDDEPRLTHVKTADFTGPWRWTSPTMSTHHHDTFDFIIMTFAIFLCLLVTAAAFWSCLVLVKVRCDKNKQNLIQKEASMEQLIHEQVTIEY